MVRLTTSVAQQKGPRPLVRPRSLCCVAEPVRQDAARMSTTKISVEFAGIEPDSWSP
jgi:hypothetical protein